MPRKKLIIPKIKCNVQIPEPEYLKIQKIAELKQWSIGKTIYNIMKGKIKYE
jgi:hypothetical protein